MSEQLGWYASTLTAPSAARERLTCALRGKPGIDEGDVQDAALIVSELVTNAVRAGSTGVCVDLETSDGNVRISVIDDAPGLPQPSDTANDLECGRGLAIVSALANAWGVTQRSDRKVVWADLSLSPV